MSTIKTGLTRIFFRFSKSIVARLPAPWNKHLVTQSARQLNHDDVARVIHTLIQEEADRRNPDDALRLLLELDNELYKLQGYYSRLQGGGLHSKHRHIKHHDFFVGRVKAGERVLDVGCGQGTVAHAVAERSGAQATGIDMDEKKITSARQNFSHPNVTYILGDVLEYLPDEPFDVVILSNVLEHLPERPEFLRRVIANVKPSRVLIRVPLFERDWRVPLKKELGLEWRLDPTHYTEYTLESFADDMAQAGLESVHLEVRWGEIWTELKPVAK